VYIRHSARRGGAYNLYGLFCQGGTKNPARLSPGGVFVSPLRAPAKDQTAACASAASSSSATMLVILIIGLTAGPAVSL
jgi:hypothetical protein